jgi:hypothetical protein
MVPSYETLKLNETNSVLFVSIDAPPMNLMGPASAVLEVSSPWLVIWALRRGRPPFSLSSSRVPACHISRRRPECDQRAHQCGCVSLDR